MKSNVKVLFFLLAILRYFFAQMDENTPSLHFSIFHFLVENKKISFFRLKLIPGTIPLKLLKRRFTESSIASTGQPFHKRVPLAVYSLTPKVFQPSAMVKKSPARLRL